MCLNAITYSVPLQYDRNGTLFPNDNHDARVEGPLGCVRLSHSAEVFEAEKKVLIEERSEFLGFYFNIGNDLKYSFDNGSPGGVMPKNHYNLVYLPQVRCHYDVRPGKYATFSFLFSREYLKIWEEQYPILREFLLNVEQCTPAFISNEPLAATTEMLAIVHDILNSKYTGIARDAHFNSSVFDIVMRCLEHITTTRSTAGQINTSLRETHLQKVREAHDYLVKHAKDRFSLPHLLDKVGLDKLRLESGFKQVYGKTMLDFVIDERLKSAIALLRDTNMPVKKIASMVGYRNHSHFTEIFKNRLEYLPSELRRSELAQHIQVTCEKTKEQEL
jgi:AraC-like DNA-binding protein